MFSNVIVTVSWAAAVLLSGNAMAQGIYTCVDGKGRKITSDRQIAECTDRTQHEVSPAGVVMRVLGPALTERELAAQEEKDKLQAVEGASALGIAAGRRMVAPNRTLQRSER